VEKVLSLGSYPDTSLQKARAKRDAARTPLADGGDPGAKRKAEKSAQTATPGGHPNSSTRGEVKLPHLTSS
jgi:hypothetical protein